MSGSFSRSGVPPGKNADELQAFPNTRSCQLCSRATVRPSAITLCKQRLTSRWDSQAFPERLWCHIRPVITQRSLWQSVAAGIQQQSFVTSQQNVLKYSNEASSILHHMILMKGWCRYMNATNGSF